MSTDIFALFKEEAKTTRSSVKVEDGKDNLKAL